MKTVKVEFNEQSKAVTATTKIEVSDDNNTDYVSVLEDAKRLFDEAFKYSQEKTLIKAKK